MMLIHRFIFGWSCCALLILQGCASMQVNQLAQSLANVGPETTLTLLEKVKPSSRDQAQYHLNLGILRFYNGDFLGARGDLEAAKKIMSVLQSTSVTENLAATTTNETLRSYDGSPSDRVLVHVILALSYLFEGNSDGARVEMLQADVTLQSLADGDSLSGQLASVRYLAGLIYEMHRERDDALISYRKAYNITKARGERVPPALQVSLLKLTQSQGFTEEYATYKKEFGHDAPSIAANDGEWILFYFDSVISRKTEARLSVFNPEANTMISVVMPQYSTYRYSPGSITLRSDSTQQRTDILENLERRAREDLDAEKTKALAAATVRAVAKYNLVQNARKNGEAAGLLANIATVMSEQADVRSWNMLPSSIQVARIVVPLDSAISIVETGDQFPSLSQAGSSRFGVLMAASISKKVFGTVKLPLEPAPKLSESKLETKKGDPNESSTSQ